MIAESSTHCCLVGIIMLHHLKAWRWVSSQTSLQSLDF